MVSASIRAAALAAMLALFIIPASAQSDIGGTISAENRVEGEVDGMPQPISTGVRIFQDERVATYTGSSASFRFNDDTTMSMGASSEVVLDTFVYNPAQSTGDIVFNAAKGAFRFATGNAGTDAYRVVTPTAVIGTRGTDFGVYITSLGTLTLGHEGAPFMCPRRLANSASPDLPECCNLDVNEKGGPVYGVLLRREGECIGPFSWDGTNPLTLLSRFANQQNFQDRSDSSPASSSNNTGNPSRRPPAPPPPPDDDDDDDDDSEGNDNPNNNKGNDSESEGCGQRC